METITDYLTAAIPSAVISTGLGAIFAGLLLADRLLTKEARGTVFNALFADDGSAGRVILTTALSAFDTLFRSRTHTWHGASWVRPSLVRTALFSGAIFVLCVLSFSSVLAPAVESIARSAHFFGPQFGALLIVALIAAILLNGLFDFVSYAETRTVYQIAKQGEVRRILAALATDLLATLVISYVSLLCVSGALLALPGSMEMFLLDYYAYAPLAGAEGWQTAGALVETTNRVFFGIFQNPMSEWTAQDRIRFVFLITTVGASFTLWGPSLIALATLYLNRFGWVARLKKVLVLETAPLTTAGIIILGPFILAGAIGTAAVSNFSEAVNGAAPSIPESEQTADADTPDEAPVEPPPPANTWEPVEFRIYFEYGRAQLSDPAEMVARELIGRFADCPGTVTAEIRSVMNPEYTPFQNGVVISSTAAAIASFLDSTAHPPDAIRIVAVEEGPEGTPLPMTPNGVREPLNRRADVSLSCETGL